MSETAVVKSKTRHNPLAEIPAAALAAELKRRQRRVQMLQRRYQRLIALADELREEIDALGGSLVGPRTAEVSGSAQLRSRNATNLVDAL